MNILTLDCETTTKEKGNPFHKENILCSVGCLAIETNNFGAQYYVDYSIEYDGNPYGQHIQEINKLIDNSDLIVGFNIKFDLHWLRKYGIISFQNKRIWDVQLVHFLLTAQQHKYPSLNEVCNHYGIENKLDIVKTEYWDKGFDTTSIPYSILSEYLKQDVFLTKQLFDLQRKEITDRQMGALASLTNQDLLVLEEMEWNGLYYDKQESLRKSANMEAQLSKLDTDLFNLVPFSFVNWTSGYHLSSILYGGIIEYVDKVPDGVYKTGQKAGEVKYRNITHSQTFPRLVEPLKRSELVKIGYWSTDEATLKQLKAKGLAKSIIVLIQEKAKLEKANGTYYKGIPELMDKMTWEDNMIHGQLNQCTVVTGRLSSTKPNVQTMDGNMKDLFISRFIN